MVFLSRITAAIGGLFEKACNWHVTDRSSSATLRARISLFTFFHSLLLLFFFVSIDFWSCKAYDKKILYYIIIIRCDSMNEKFVEIFFKLSREFHL